MLQVGPQWIIQAVFLTSPVGKNLDTYLGLQITSFSLDVHEKGRREIICSHLQYRTEFYFLKVLQTCMDITKYKIFMEIQIQLV